MLGKFFFQKCPYFDEGAGEGEIKISLIKMSLFIVGEGEGLIEKGVKSRSLLSFFLGHPLFNFKC